MTMPGFVIEFSLLSSIGTNPPNDGVTSAVLTTAAYLSGSTCITYIEIK